MTTTPGFSSRSTTTPFHQFPHRDGAPVTDIAGMETPGWSNANRVTADDEAPQVDEKVVAEDTVEDKAVSKKTSARKSTARKKG